MGSSQSKNADSEVQTKSANSGAVNKEINYHNDNHDLYTADVQTYSGKDINEKFEIETVDAPPKQEEAIENTGSKVSTITQNLTKINNYIQELNQDVPSIKVSTMLLVQSCLSKINAVLINIEKNNQASEEKVLQHFEEVTKAILLNDEVSFKQKLDELSEYSRNAAN